MLVIAEGAPTSAQFRADTETCIPTGLRHIPGTGFATSLIRTFEHTRQGVIAFFEVMFDTCKTEEGGFVVQRLCQADVEQSDGGGFGEFIGFPCQRTAFFFKRLLSEYIQTGTYFGLQQAAAENGEAETG